MEPRSRSHAMKLGALTFGWLYKAPQKYTVNTTHITCKFQVCIPYSLRQRAVTDGHTD